MNVWTWAHEHEQMSSKEYFQKYHVDVDEILIDTYDEIFGDMEEYFDMCHGWIISLNEKWMIFQINVGNKITMIN